MGQALIAEATRDSEDADFIVVVDVAEEEIVVDDGLEPVLMKSSTLGRGRAVAPPPSVIPRESESHDQRFSKGKSALPPLDRETS